MKTFLIFFAPIYFFVVFLFVNLAYAGTLSCSITTAAACTNTAIFRMSSTTNAHAELPGQSNANYNNNVVCCSGVTGLGNSCSGTFATALKLSSTTNAHSEQNSQSNYANSACIQVPSGGSVSVGYQGTNCSGFDTTLGSMSGVTNAHIGNSAAYSSIRICATASGPQTLTFSISDNSIGFGSLSSSVARFATGDGLGGGGETEAHQIQVSSNGASGYAVTVQGATLTAGAFTISPIGGTNTASSPGNEQFGLRMTASGGSGAVSSPYAASGFAYAGSATSSSQVAGAATGDDVTTTYSVRYLSNIRGDTENAAYTSNLIYVATANF